MLLIEFADGMRLEMVGLGEAEGLGRQLEGLEVTEPCGLEATMRGRRLAASAQSFDAKVLQLRFRCLRGLVRRRRCKCLPRPR